MPLEAVGLPVIYAKWGLVGKSLCDDSERLSTDRKKPPMCKLIASGALLWVGQRGSQAFPLALFKIQRSLKWW